MTIVEEINYKEAMMTSKKQHEHGPRKVEKKRETSADTTTSRKIPAKVLFDLLKTTEADVNGSQCALKTNFGANSSGEMELVTIPSSLSKKLALDIDFLSKTNETCALKDELTSLNRLKESNKVREIINSFNNFEKNNTNSSKDMNSKKKYFSKFNTINISNLGKPPPPVKKFNNPNNKLSTNPATATSTASTATSTPTATVIDIQEKKNMEPQSTASLSFQLNTSESKAEKRLMKLAASSETKQQQQKGGENVSPVSKTLLIPKSAATTNQQNANLVFLNNVTAKNLINTENLISKLTDSIIKSDSQSINNDINIINNKLAKIVNMLNNEANNSGSAVVQGGGGAQAENVNAQQQLKLKKPDNLKALELGQQKASNNDSESSASNSDSLQLPSVNPSSRKRTFANMVWPMDPEEEKILRSCSPYEVPEVIVQRNDSVKSILKKNNFLQQTIASAPPAFVSSSMSSEASNKKRVDFHENCCFINFFEIQDDELITTSS